MVASNHPDYKENDIVHGSMDWAEYTIVKGGNMLRKLDTMEFPLSYHVGIFGTYIISVLINLWPKYSFYIT